MVSASVSTLMKDFATNDILFAAWYAAASVSCRREVQHCSVNFCMAENRSANDTVAPSPWEIAQRRSSSALMICLYRSSSFSAEAVVEMVMMARIDSQQR